MSPGGMLSKGRSHPLERWGFGVICFGLIGFFFILLAPTPTRVPLSDVVVAFLVAGFMFTSVIGTFMVLKGRQRGARDVMARAGRVCPRCRYPLPPSENLGVCPECGDPFTHEDNVRAWRERYPWLRL